MMLHRHAIFEVEPNFGQHYLLIKDLGAAAEGFHFHFSFLSLSSNTEAFQTSCGDGVLLYYSHMYYNLVDK